MSIAEKILQLKKDFDDVFEAGRKSQYDEFWDSYQYNGSRTNYMQAFSGSGWNINTFFPKYDINAIAGSNVPDNAQEIFYNFNNNSQHPAFDFAERLEKQGVKLETSTWAKHYLSFANMKVTRLPELDFTNATSGGYTFQSSGSIVTIDKIKSSVNTYWEGCFNYCSGLVNLIIEGEIGKNLGIGFSTNLSEASIRSIVSHLSDNVTGKTVTFSKIAKEAAFTADEWSMLLETKPNWTFSLV